MVASVAGRLVFMHQHTGTHTIAWQLFQILLIGTDAVCVSARVLLTLLLMVMEFLNVGAFDAFTRFISEMAINNAAKYLNYNCVFTPNFANHITHKAKANKCSCI